MDGYEVKNTATYKQVCRYDSLLRRLRRPLPDEDDLEEFAALSREEAFNKIDKLEYELESLRAAPSKSYLALFRTDG